MAFIIYIQIKVIIWYIKYWMTKQDLHSTGKKIIEHRNGNYDKKFLV